MHTLTIKVNDEGYSHLMYILQNLSSVEVSENIAIDENKSRKKFLNRIKSSKNDIKNNKILNFDFKTFLKDIEDV